MSDANTLVREDAIHLEEQGRASEADALIERLRSMPLKDIAQSWIEQTVALSAEETNKVIKFVARTTGVATAQLQASLKQERRQNRSGRANTHRLGLIDSRAPINYEPENLTRQAQEVEAAIVATATPGSYVSFGGVLCEVAARPMPYTHAVDDDGATAPPILQVAPLDSVGMRERVESVVVFLSRSRDGWRPRSVPPEIIEILLKKRSHSAPIVTGLLTHPLVLPSGSILARPGLDAETGLYLSGQDVDEPVAFTREEAARAIGRLREELFQGFEFASAMDADVALAGLLTAVERRVLDSAPGLAVIASAQSSGKTTLARMLHVVLTGHDMPVSSFPEGDEAEMQKRLLSILLRSPAMVCLDNLTDGTTFRSPSVAAAMTSPMLTQRVLGVSRDADCPTNVFFVLTGNNLGLGADELTRWLVTRLEPKTAQPDKRSFKHSDVVAHARAIRGGVLRDVIGIVAGYLRSGGGIRPASRFPRWDRVVRQPLMWAGASDVAQAFKANADSSEDLLAHRALLSVLHELFGAQEFLARDVVSCVKGYGVPMDRSGKQWDVLDDSLPVERERAQRLEECLVQLRAKDPQSLPSVGRVLKASEGRFASFGQDGSQVARLRSRLVNGHKKWFIEVGGTA